VRRDLIREPNFSPLPSHQGSSHSSTSPFFSLQPAVACPGPSSRGVWRRKSPRGWPVSASINDTLQRAEQESWGQLQMLDHLLEEELAAREARRIRAGLKLAAFPLVKTLDAFDFAFQPSIDRARVMDLAALTFLQRKENVLLLGPPGVGKTHLAVALAVRACQHGASVYFTTLDGMIRALAAADAAGKLARKLKTFTTKSQLLVIDEVGYLPLSRAEANYLFQVVAARYERSSLILTSNKAVSEWPELFADSNTTDCHRN
jgi:DNA replication protein DnaC